MTPTPILLENVLIARPRRPAAPGAIAISGGHIALAGDVEAVHQSVGRLATGDPGRPAVEEQGRPVGHARSLRAQEVRRIDGRGAVAMPGFDDPHCHPLAFGAALTAADCQPSAAPSIQALQRTIDGWAASHPDAPWVRAFGYDELLIAERRHPDRGDLDAAVPDRPVMLIHGGGHAAVLNTAGLRAVGITASTDEPPGGFIDREPETGAPSGLLLEMGDFLSTRMERPSRQEVTGYAAAASAVLVRAGVTSVTDTGPANGPPTFSLWAELLQQGHFAPRITLMRPPMFPPAPPPSGDSRVSAGPIKVMLNSTGGNLDPDPVTLQAIALAAAKAKVGLAVHAIDEPSVLAACDAFESASRSIRHESGPAPFLRVEHASEMTERACAALLHAGATVVTQPGFVYGRGDRYTAEPHDRIDLDDLYAVRRLLEHGIPVLASSDAPYGPESPIDAIYAAVTRKSRSGRPIGTSQTIGVPQALCLYFREAADGNGEAAWAGLMPGAPADLVLLSDDPASVPAERIRDVRPVGTFIRGEPVWAA